MRRDIEWRRKDRRKWLTCEAGVKPIVIDSPDERLVGGYQILDDIDFS